jgi:hypothetical protein
MMQQFLTLMHGVDFNSIQDNASTDIANEEATFMMDKPTPRVHVGFVYPHQTRFMQVQIPKPTILIWGQVKTHET